MKRPRYILRYFYVPTLSWMGGRYYDDLGRAADDYVDLATNSRDSVCRIEIYDLSGYVTGTGYYSPQYLLFADAWADEKRAEIALAVERRVDAMIGHVLAELGRAG